VTRNFSETIQTYFKSIPNWVPWLLTYLRRNTACELYQDSKRV